MRVVEVNVGNKAKGSSIETLVGEAMQSSAVQSQQVILFLAQPSHPPCPSFCLSLQMCD